MTARYAYFHNLSQEDLPYIKIPLHTVIKLTPKAYGCDEERYKVPIQAVDTHRPKPQNTPGHNEAEIDQLSNAKPERTFFADTAAAAAAGTGQATEFV